MTRKKPQSLIYKDGKKWIIADDGSWVEIKEPAAPPPPPPPKAQYSASSQR